MAWTERWHAINSDDRPVIMWGAADQGRVNYHILKSIGVHVLAFVDDTPGKTTPIEGIPLLAGETALAPFLAGLPPCLPRFVIAIGNPYAAARRERHAVMRRLGLQPASFADTSARLCLSARLGEGLQVMPMAIVNNDTQIGTQCILNTRSLVEHDCVLHDGVEIGPGAVLCGRVTVMENTWIGANATVNPRLKIGKNSIVGAGAVVVRDVPDNVIVTGVPAQILKRLD